MNKFLLPLLLLLFGCHHKGDDSHPKLDYAVQDRYLKQLPSPFEPLSEYEKLQEWGKEETIALHFANELDLYQAITAFKRARFLIPSDLKERKTELDYQIFLCYYLGKKYLDALHTFETTTLHFVTAEFPAYLDLLIILYDCYLQTNQEEQADRILQMVQAYNPEAAKKLHLSGLLIQGNIPLLRAEAPQAPPICSILTQYDQYKKSVGTAQWLNTFIPGTGYLYIGQTQSALTAFFLNGLFIWAAVSFFQNGYIAAGAITTSFEAGWYFGGIYGAAQETKFYNERIYETVATPVMNENRYFPILMITHAF